jgi:hypothetical protein
LSKSSLSIGIHKGLHNVDDILHLDIMTSNGGRLTPDVTRVSLPKPVPQHVET